MRGRSGRVVSLSILEQLERARANASLGPTIFAQVKNGKGVDHIVELILSAWRSCGASAASEGTNGA
jgi:urease accessory protein